MENPNYTPPKNTLYDSAVFVDDFSASFADLGESTDSLLITTVFLDWDDESQTGTTAHYKNLDKLKISNDENLVVKEALRFLEGFKIDLERDDFLISSFFQDWKNPQQRSKIDLSHEALKIIRLADYFKNSPIDLLTLIRGKSQPNFSQDVEGFKKAENIMISWALVKYYQKIEKIPSLDHLTLEFLQKLDLNKVVFIPVPIFFACRFVGMTYIVYEAHEIIEKNLSEGQIPYKKDWIIEATTAIEDTATVARSNNLWSYPRGST